MSTPAERLRELLGGGATEAPPAPASGDDFYTRLRSAAKLDQKEEPKPGVLERAGSRLRELMDSDDTAEVALPAPATPQNRPVTLPTGPAPSMVADATARPAPPRVAPPPVISERTPDAQRQEHGVIGGLIRVPGRVAGHFVEGTGQTIQAVAAMSRMAPTVTPELNPHFLEMVGGGLETTSKKILDSKLLRASTSVREDGAFQPKNWRWWTEAGGEAVGQLAAQIGLAMLTGGESAMARFLTFAAPVAVLDGGNAFAETRDDLVRKGMDPELAQARAAGSFALTATGSMILEAAPERVIFGRVPGAEKFFRDALAKRMAKVASTAGVEGFTEAGQEAWGATVQYAVQQDPKALEGLGERMKGAFTLGAVAGGVAGTRTPYGEHDADPGEPINFRRKLAEAIDPEGAQERRNAVRAAETDQLTGLANRSALDKAIASAEADPNTAVIAFDLNNFGAINKKLGHDIGDYVLSNAAKRLKAAAEEFGVGERVFRRGGDEFVILAPADIAEQVRTRAEELVGGDELVAGQPWSISGTTGSTFAEADATLQQRKAERKALAAAAPVEVTPPPPSTQVAPGDVVEYPLDELDVEPDRFQFKANTDAATGTGQELKSVKKFDRRLAGVILAWVDPGDGRAKVVNGHHRVELARRTGETSMTTRFIEATTAEEARKIGAMVNIAEGRGTAVDAAKLFRDEGTTPQELEENGISLSGATAKNGLALANLHEALFSQVATGKMKEARGVVIGASGISQPQQLALAAMLRQQEATGRNVTDEQLRELIRFVAGAGEANVEQETLFGTEQINQSLAIEKAQLSSAVKKKLAADRRLFSFLSKGDRAERIEASGTGSVDVEAAGSIASESAQVEEVYNRLSMMSGPVSAALNRAASQLANGVKINELVPGLHAEIRAAVETELAALGGKRGSEADAGGNRAAEGAEPDTRTESAKRLEAFNKALENYNPNERFEQQEEEADDDTPDPNQQALFEVGRQGSLFGGDDIVGKAPKRGSDQGSLFGALQGAEVDAQNFIAKWKDYIERGGDNPTIRAKYRDSLALVRRAQSQSEQEVRLRSENVPDDAPGDTGSLFDPENVSTSYVLESGINEARAVEPDASIEQDARRVRQLDMRIAAREATDAEFDEYRRITRRIAKEQSEQGVHLPASEQVEESEDEWLEDFTAYGDQMHADELTGDDRLYPSMEALSPVMAAPNKKKYVPIPGAGQGPPPGTQPQITERMRGELETTAPRGHISHAAVTDSYTAILQAAAKQMGTDQEVPERFGKRKVPRTARGAFWPQAMIRRVREAGNIPTSAHEMGHALEKLLYGWPKGGPWKKPLVSKVVQQELYDLGYELYGDTKPAAGYKREGWAEYVRLWLTVEDHTSLHIMAPNLHAWFNGEFSQAFPLVRLAMNEARGTTTKYRNQGSAGRALGNTIRPGRLPERMRGIRRSIKTFLTIEKQVEMAEPFRKVSKRASESMGREIAEVDDPYELLVARRQTHGAIVRGWVEGSGITNTAGMVTGPALNEIKPLVEKSSTARRYGMEPQETFTIYLWAKRTLALATTGRNSGLDVKDAVRIVQELETTEFQLAAQIVYDWNDGVLEYAAQASPVFRSVVQRVRKSDPGYYIPLRRAFESLDGAWSRSTGATNRSPVARLKGSGLAIKDPISTMISAAEKTVRKAHERQAVEALVRLRNVEGIGQFIEPVPVDEIPILNRSLGELLATVQARLAANGIDLVTLDGNGDPVELSPDDHDFLNEMLTFWGPKQFTPAGKPIFPHWNGRRVEWFELDADLFNALSTLDQYRGTKAVEILFGKPGAVFRAGTTTMRASFGLIWNPLRDVQSLYANTRSSANAFQIFGAWMSSMKDMALARTIGKQNEFIDFYQRIGGEMAQPLGEDMAPADRAARRLFQSKKEMVLDPRNWWDFYRDFVQFPESAARIAEIKLVAKDMGWEPGMPMTESQALRLLTASKQVTVDFTAAGEFGRAMNRIAPFYNAAIQGPRASLRAYKRNPFKFVARGMQLTAVTLLLWWRNKDEEWYQNLDYKEKFLHWFIPVPGQDAVVKIPRSFETGTIFGALPEMLFDAAWTNNPNEALAWFSNFAAVMTPNVEPVLFAQAFDQYKNENRFWNTPIETKAEEERFAKDRYNEYTSRVAIFLGKTFPAWSHGDHVGLSPKRIDHAINGIFGPFAGDIIGVLGLGSRELDKEWEASDTPVVGRIFQRGGKTGTRPRPINELYDLVEHVQKREKSRKFRDEFVDPDERQLRLQIEDAQKAVTALLYVRRFTTANEPRRQLTEEALSVAADAVAAYKAQEQDRATFRALRVDAERRMEEVKEEKRPF